MSHNVKKKRLYDYLAYNMLNTKLDITGISFHKMWQSAKKVDDINDYGFVIALA